MWIAAKVPLGPCESAESADPSPKFAALRDEPAGSMELLPAEGVRGIRRFRETCVVGRPVEPPERNDRLYENGQEGCVTDYLVIGFPHQSGSWAAVFPDFVGVTGRGSDLAQAIDRATEGAISVVRILTKIGAPLPPPKDLRKVQLEHLWANEYGINWSCAVVSTVALHPQLAGEPAPVRPTQRRRIQPFAAPGRAESHVRMSVPPQAGIVVGMVPNPGVQHTEAYI